jgi:hypothetical protein
MRLHEHSVDDGVVVVAAAKAHTPCSALCRCIMACMMCIDFCKSMVHSLLVVLDGVPPGVGAASFGVRVIRTLRSCIVANINVPLWACLGNQDFLKVASDVMCDCIDQVCANLSHLVQWDVMHFLFQR